MLGTVEMMRCNTLMRSFDDVQNAEQRIVLQDGAVAHMCQPFATSAVTLRAYQGDFRHPVPPRIYVGWGRPISTLVACDANLKCPT